MFYSTHLQAKQAWIAEAGAVISRLSSANVSSQTVRTYSTLIRQRSSDKEPGWESLVLAALWLCPGLCNHAHRNLWLCESWWWYRGFDLWLTRQPTWCLRPESQLLEAVWLQWFDWFITSLVCVLTWALRDVCRWGQRDSSNCWLNTFCSDGGRFVFGIIMFR